MTLREFYEITVVDEKTTVHITYYPDRFNIQRIEVPGYVFNDPYMSLLNHIPDDVWSLTIEEIIIRRFDLYLEIYPECFG